MILRIALFAFLISDSLIVLRVAAGQYLPVPALIAAVTGGLLLLGFWTPVAGMAVVILETGIAVFRPDGYWASALAAAIALGLALLGPGAWSLDSRVYGRKRITIRNR